MRFLRLVCATAVVAAPLHSVCAQEAVQLVRAGDNAMTCEALASEINTLAALGAPPPVNAEPQLKKKKGGLGFLSRALASAAPMLGGGMGGAAGALITQAAGAAQSAAMESQIDRQTDIASRAAEMAIDQLKPSVATQRKERLMTVFQEKRC